MDAGRSRAGPNRNHVVLPLAALAQTNEACRQKPEPVHVAPSTMRTRGGNGAMMDAGRSRAGPNRNHAVLPLAALAQTREASRQKPEPVHVAPSTMCTPLVDGAMMDAGRSRAGPNRNHAVLPLAALAQTDEASRQKPEPARVAPSTMRTPLVDGAMMDAGRSRAGPNRNHAVLPLAALVQISES